MKNLKNKLARFLKDNDGLETLEIAAIGAGAVILVAILAGIYNNANEVASGVPDEVGGIELPGG